VQNERSGYSILLSRSVNNVKIDNALPHHEHASAAICLAKPVSTRRIRDEYDTFYRPTSNFRRQRLIRNDIRTFSLVNERDTSDVTCVDREKPPFIKRNSDENEQYRCTFYKVVEFFEIRNEFVD